ncbi:aspartyl-phosphate phosphatase Spo0E family protein [Bacillus sp. JJ1764]|uniref:aspartyl-phosphate phosphatase Spo0E family protein n=1 Tax=Bacillus sp. JJ1764 TaxID=3122964 RepID=UPI002FFDCCD8
MLKIRLIHQKRKLKNHMELLRNEMMRLGLKEGLSNKRTVQVSKKLDQAILKYQSLNT